MVGIVRIRVLNYINSGHTIWKKRNAVCIKTTISLDKFDIPLDLRLLEKNLTSKLYPVDIENYVYEQIKYDKTVKNKVLSMFYNQRIELSKHSRDYRG